MSVLLERVPLKREQLNINVDARLAKRLKHRAVDLDEKPGRIVERLLRAYLDEMPDESISEQ
jgi:hypothetical protein